MEIEFIKFNGTSVVGKLIFTDTKIIGVMPNYDRQNKLLGGINLGLINLDTPDPSISIIGEVNIPTLKSIYYSSTAYRYTLRLVDNDNNYLAFYISCYASLSYALTYFQIERVYEALRKRVYPILISSILINLSHDKPCRIHDVDMFINGIRLDRRRFFKDDKILVSWNRLKYVIEDEYVIISEYNSPFIKTMLYTGHPNVCLFPYIIEIMKVRNHFIR